MRRRQPLWAVSHSQRFPVADLLDQRQRPDTVAAKPHHPSAKRGAMVTA